MILIYFIIRLNLNNMDTESSETGGDILGPKRMNY